MDKKQPEPNFQTFTYTGNNETILKPGYQVCLAIKAEMQF